MIRKKKDIYLKKDTLMKFLVSWDELSQNEDIEGGEFLFDKAFVFDLKFGVVDLN